MYCSRCVVLSKSGAAAREALARIVLHAPSMREASLVMQPPVIGVLPDPIWKSYLRVGAGRASLLEVVYFPCSSVPCPLQHGEVFVLNDGGEVGPPLSRVSVVAAPQR